MSTIAGTRGEQFYITPAAQNAGGGVLANFSGAHFKVEIPLPISQVRGEPSRVERKVNTAQVYIDSYILRTNEPVLQLANVTTDNYKQPTFVVDLIIHSEK